MAYTTTGRRPGAAGPAPRAVARYDGGSVSVARSRAFTAAFLDRAAAGHAVHVTARARAEARLVVSELVTNACKYAPGPVTLVLRVRGRLLEVELRDGVPAPPAVLTAAAPGRVGGHGLEIVLALCEALQVRPAGAGKRVVATLALDRL